MRMPKRLAIEQWVDRYNYRWPHLGLGGFLAPGDRFHGKAYQVLEEIAKGIYVTGASVGIERIIINLVVDSKEILTFYLLGKPVAITGENMSVEMTAEDPICINIQLCAQWSLNCGTQDRISKISQNIGFTRIEILSEPSGYNLIGIGTKM